MTDGVKELASDLSEAPVLGIKKPLITKSLGIDIDQTGAAFAPDTGEFHFSKPLAHYYMTHSEHWDAIFFVTSRKISTSAASMLESFTKELPFELRMLETSLEGIEKSFEIDLKTEIVPFVSAFDHSGSTGFLGKVLLPFEGMFEALLLSAKTPDGTRDHRAIKDLCYEIYRLSLYTADEPTKKSIEYQFHTHVFDTSLDSSISLSDRLASFKGALSKAERRALRTNKVNVPIYFDMVGSAIQLFYLRTYFSAHPELGDYCSKYYDELYPIYKLHGKTPSLIQATNLRSLEKSDSYYLGLIDDTPKVLELSKAGAKHIREELKIEAAIKTVHWEEGNEECVSKLDTLLSHSESPKSVTTWFDIAATAEKATSSAAKATITVI